MTRILYFDIDGTVLPIDDDEPKRLLRRGELEKAIRGAGFEKLICAGNIGIVTRAVRGLGVDCDELKVVFELLGDAIDDMDWFLAMTKMSVDPENRAASIDLESDWWYVDDLAQYYLEKAHRSELLRSPASKRIYVPRPKGDGSGLLKWLRSVPI